MLAVPTLQLSLCGAGRSVEQQCGAGKSVKQQCGEGPSVEQQCGATPAPTGGPSAGRL